MKYQIHRTRICIFYLLANKRKMYYTALSVSNMFIELIIIKSYALVPYSIPTHFVSAIQGLTYFML